MAEASSKAPVMNRFTPMIFLADGIAGDKLFPASDQRLLRRRHVAHALQLEVLVIGQLQRGQRRVENAGWPCATSSNSR